MEHIMHLDPSSFSKVKNGTKTIELRLYDEKRRQICPDDTIRFICRGSSPQENLLMRAAALYVFDSFEALYKALPLQSCGYSREELAQADAKDMERYYSAEEQRRYGVIGICLSSLEEPDEEEAAEEELDEEEEA